MEGQLRFSIGHLKIVDHLILGVANHQLEAKQALLDHSTLDTIECNSWSQICDLLTQGTVNGAFMTIPSAMDLFARGLDIRLLMFTHRGGGIIVKKNNSHLKQLADFKDHTVLVPSKLCVHHMLIHRLLTSTGLTPGFYTDTEANVLCEPVNPFLMPQMLDYDNDNDIAGFAVSEPYGSQAIIQKNAEPVCSTGRLWKNHPCCAYVLQKECLDQFPEAVEELISVFIQAARTLETKKSSDLPAVARHFLIQDESIVKKTISSGDLSFAPKLLAPDPAPINIIQDYMADTMKIIDTKIDIDQFVDPSFFSQRMKTQP